MAKKEVSFTTTPIPKPPARSVEDFVERGIQAQEAAANVSAASAEPAEPAKPAVAEPMKRLTLDIPASLHKRLKRHCTEEEVTIADLIRGILIERFPAA